MCWLAWPPCVRASGQQECPPLPAPTTLTAASHQEVMPERSLSILQESGRPPALTTLTALWLLLLLLLLLVTTHHLTPWVSPSLTVLCVRLCQHSWIPCRSLRSRLSQLPLLLLVRSHTHQHRTQAFIIVDHITWHLAVSEDCYVFITLSDLNTFI